jgi:hypothetical protein
MAIFASTLFSLAEMVAAKNADTTSWHTLRVLTYYALVLNLGGAFLSVVIIKMCSDARLAAAMQTLLSEENRHTRPATKDDPKWVNTGSDSDPLAVADGGTSEATTLKGYYPLLESFGVSPLFKWVIRINSWVVVLASVCTITAWSLWVFLNETLVTAGVTIIISGSTLILIVGVFITGNRAQGWR